MQKVCFLEKKAISGGYSNGDCVSALLQKIEDQYGCFTSAEYNAYYNYYSQPGMCG